MIYDRPNHFGRIPLVLDVSNLFCSGPNHFEQVQIIKLVQKSNSNLNKMTWTQPKNNFVPIQENLDSPKIFGLVEGQGMKLKIFLQQQQSKILRSLE